MRIETDPRRLTRDPLPGRDAAAAAGVGGTPPRRAAAAETGRERRECWPRSACENHSEAGAKVETPAWRTTAEPKRQEGTGKAQPSASAPKRQEGTGHPQPPRKPLPGDESANVLAPSIPDDDEPDEL